MNENLDVVKDLSIIEETLYGGYLNIAIVQKLLSDNINLKDKPVDYLLEKRNQLKGMLDEGVASCIHLSPGIRYIFIDSLHDIYIEDIYTKKIGGNNYLIINMSYKNCFRSLRFKKDHITYAFTLKDDLNPEFLNRYKNAIIVQHTFSFLVDGTKKLTLILWKEMDTTWEIVFDDLMIYEKI